MTKLKLAAALLVACAGCAAMRWTHPTKPESELAVDEYECDRESLATFPQVLTPDGQDLNEQRRWGLSVECLKARGWR